MELEKPPRADPSEFRKQAKFVGLAGLGMDILVAIVILAFMPFEQTIVYILVIALVGAGVVLAYVFAVVFPNNYEKNYQRMYEPRLK